MSTRRLAGEVAQLRRQVASETVRTAWSKPGHQRQYEVLQRIRGVFIVDLAKALEAVFGSGADVPLDISAVVAAGEKLIAAGGQGVYGAGGDYTTVGYSGGYRDSGNGYGGGYRPAGQGEL